MQSKVSQIRAAWLEGRKLDALKVAACFHDRSPETKLFQRGHQAVLHPSFFTQVGKDPEALTAAALDALAAKFGLPT